MAQKNLTNRVLQSIVGEAKEIIEKNIIRKIEELPKAKTLKTRPEDFINLAKSLYPRGTPNQIQRIAQEIKRAALGIQVRYKDKLVRVVKRKPSIVFGVEKIDTETKRRAEDVGIAIPEYQLEPIIYEIKEIKQLLSDILAVSSFSAEKLSRMLEIQEEKILEIERRLEAL